MSFTDIILLKKVTHSVISITAALVALLGGWILISAFTSEPETRYVLPPQVGGGEISNASRAPQSVGKASLLGLLPSKIVAAPELKVETFNLGCLNQQKDGLTLKSSAKQVRIKAQFCDGKRTAIAESSIVNRTNGYMATLFNLNRGEFTSDYISLAEGQNQIIFQIADEQGGRSTADITIHRQ